MDILRSLFEQHFHLPVERVQPLQGQLGGSGRKIIRLRSGKISAIGILYDVREENVAFLEFSRHFREHGLPVPEIYAQDLDQGAYLEEDLGDTSLFEFLSKHRAGDQIAPAVVEAYRKVIATLPRFQIEAGRDLNYKVVLSARKFRPAVHFLGLELFQVLFPATGGHSFQRTGTGRRFQPADQVSVERGARLLSISGLPVAQHHAARRPAFFPRLSGRAQGRAAV